MKTLNINKIYTNSNTAYMLYSIIACVLLWQVAPIVIQWLNGTAGMIDGSIWLLLLFTVISFTSLTFLCGLMLQIFVLQLGLPRISSIVQQFKTLTLCQQFAFYWSSFALLLLAAVMSLIAVF